MTAAAVFNSFFKWVVALLLAIVLMAFVAHFAVPAMSGQATRTWDAASAPLAAAAEVPSSASTAETAMTDSLAAEQLDGQHANAQMVGVKAQPLIQGVTDITGFITGTATAVWTSLAGEVR